MVEISIQNPNILLPSKESFKPVEKIKLWGQDIKRRFQEWRSHAKKDPTEVLKEIASSSSDVKTLQLPQTEDSSNSDTVESPTEQPVDVEKGDTSKEKTWQEVAKQSDVVWDAIRNYLSVDGNQAKTDVFYKHQLHLSSIGVDDWNPINLRMGSIAAFAFAEGDNNQLPELKQLANLCLARVGIIVDQQSLSDVFVNKSEWNKRLRQLNEGQNHDSDGANIINSITDLEEDLNGMHGYKSDKDLEMATLQLKAGERPKRFQVLETDTQGKPHLEDYSENSDIDIVPITPKITPSENLILSESETDERVQNWRNILASNTANKRYLEHFFQRTPTPVEEIEGRRYVRLFRNIGSTWEEAPTANSFVCRDDRKNTHKKELNELDSLYTHRKNNGIDDDEVMTTLINHHLATSDFSVLIPATTSIRYAERFVPDQSTRKVISLLVPMENIVPVSQIARDQKRAETFYQEEEVAIIGRIEPEWVKGVVKA